METKSERARRMPPVTPRWKRLRAERRWKAALRRALMRGRREVERTWRKEGAWMPRDAEMLSVQVVREPGGALYAASTMGTMLTFREPYVVKEGHCDDCDTSNRLCSCIPF